MTTFWIGAASADAKNADDGRDPIGVRGLRPNHAVLADDGQTPVDAPFGVLHDGALTAAAGAGERSFCGPHEALAFALALL